MGNNVTVYRVLGGASEELGLPSGRKVKTRLGEAFEVTEDELRALHDFVDEPDGTREVTRGDGTVVKRVKHKAVDKGLNPRFSLTPPGAAAAPGPPRKKLGGDA